MLLGAVQRCGPTFAVASARSCATGDVARPHLVDSRRRGGRRPVDGLDYAPLVVRPTRSCASASTTGTHTGEAAGCPTIRSFAKFTSSLIGAHDKIVLPSVSEMVDWEAELAVVIGGRARHVSEADALEAIAGYTVLNDVWVRDYQNRTLQWLQGKTFEHSTPVGPWLVTCDESPGPRSGDHQ